MSQGGPLWQAPASLGGLAVYRNGVADGGGSFVEYNMDDVAGTTLTTSGVILFDSGGSDGSYANNENYTVTFQASASQTVQATMTFCEVEAYYMEGVTFSDNGVPITNKISGSGSNSTGFWSSHSLPYVVQSSSNVMQISFRSDGSINDAGFRIEVIFQ